MCLFFFIYIAGQTNKGGLEALNDSVATSLVCIASGMAEQRVLYWVSRICIHRMDSVTVRWYAAATSCEPLYNVCTLRRGAAAPPRGA
jgi:hypothetical protein